MEDDELVQFDEVVEDDHGGDPEEHTEEDSEVVGRTLAAIVKENPHLYNKQCADFKNDNMKKQSWNSIADALDMESGEAALKLFNSYRAKYGKERRKVLASMGRSGAGAAPVYVPSWVLYTDFEFLRDHVIPRKTASNYKSVKVPSAARSAAGAPSTAMPIVRSQTPVRPVPRVQGKTSTMTRASPSPSNTWNPDIFSSIAHTESSGVEDCSRDCSPSSPMSGTFSPPVPSCSRLVLQSRSDSPGDSSDTSSASRAVLDAMTTKVARAVPPSDVSKKRKAEDEFFKSVKNQNETFQGLASQMMKVLTPTPTTEQPKLSDPLMQPIQYAFDQVAGSDKLQCMMDVVTLISTKYLKKS